MIFLFLSVALILNLIACRNGFFLRPHHTKVDPPHLTFYKVLTPFLLYFGLLFCLQYFFMFLHFKMGKIILLSIIPSVVVLLSLALYGWINRGQMAKVWRQVYPPKLSQDLLIGFCGCVVSLPVALLVSQICESILSSYGLQSQDQVNILILKMAQKDKYQLSVVLFNILIFAPLVEEFIFRGCLQSWLKAHIGRRAAILVASLPFSLMHFNVYQKWGNIPIVVTLFTLSLFLGWVYERQGALIAPIVMHFSFNGLMTFLVLFLY